MMKSPKVEPNPCNYQYLHSGGGEGDKWGGGEGIPGLIDS